MADTEIIKIINIKTDAAIQSVKELKNYINDLRDDLIKTERGSKEYEETLQEIAKAQSKLTEVTRDSKNAMNYAEGSYKTLNQELVNLRNEYRNLSAEERNSAEVGGRILTRIQELDTELKSIDATMGQYTRSVGNYKSAIEDVTVSYQSQRQELKALRVALEQLDPASQEYITAFNRAAEITHNLTEQQEMLKYSSKDLGDQISNIRGIATGMVAGFSAVNAAMGLFGEKNEDVAKALLKVQQCMAIVQGLQGMDGLLKRTQGLSNAMKAWYTSTVQVTAAEGKQAVATTLLTGAQKGLNAAMKANPIGAVLTAVLALTAAIGPLINLFDKLSGKTQKIKEAADASNKAMAELDRTISNMDKENRLELLLMQASGFTELQIIEFQLNQEQKLLNERTNTYGILLLSLVETLGQYNDDCHITTGTLKELGVEQKDINDLMSAGTINIVESEKAMKKLVKSADFKTILDNFIKLKQELDGIDSKITELKQNQSAATVSTTVIAQNEAKRRIEAERNAAKQIAQAAEEALMTEEQLLTKRYNENKKKLEKFHIDTKNLTEQYYRDLKEIQEKNKIDWDFSSSGFDKLKEQMDEFFNTYKKNSLELLTYQKNNTIKMLDTSKQEEYKYFEDLYNKGRITEEQLNNAKLKIDKKYLAVKKQLEDKYQIDYSKETIKSYDEVAKKAGEKTQQAIDEVNAKYDQFEADNINKTSIIGIALGLDTNRDVALQKQRMDELYQTERQGLEKQELVWEQAANDEKLTLEERKFAWQMYYATIEAMRKKDAEKAKEDAEAKRLAYLKYLAAVSNGLGSIGDMFSTLADMRKDDIDNQKKNNEISDKEAEKQYEQKVKPLMIAQATVNMLQGMVAAFSSAQSLGPIAGPIVGAALASLVAGVGALNIAKIKQTKYNGGGSSSSSASVPAPSTDYAYQPMYVQNQTSQSDTDNLRNAISDGMSSVNLSVSVTEINDVQKRVKVRESESDF